MPFLVVMPRVQPAPQIRGYLDRLSSDQAGNGFTVSGVLFDPTGDQYIVRWRSGSAWYNRDLTPYLTAGTVLEVDADHFWSLGEANTADSWEYTSGSWTYYTVDSTPSSGRAHTRLSGRDIFMAFAETQISSFSTNVLHWWTNDGTGTWTGGVYSGLGARYFLPSYHGCHTSYNNDEVWIAGASEDTGTGARWPFVAKVYGASGYSTGLQLHDTRTPPDYGEIRAIDINVGAPAFLAVESIRTTGTPNTRSSKVWYSTSTAASITWTELTPPLDGGDNLDLYCGLLGPGVLWVGGSYRNAAGLYDLYLAKYNPGTSTWNRYTIAGYAVSADIDDVWHPTIRDLQGGSSGADVCGNGVLDSTDAHGAFPFAGSLFSGVWTEYPL